jgi:hypothetical protein
MYHFYYYYALIESNQIILDATDTAPLTLRFKTT